MDNICENIEEYNPDKEHKVLVAWIYASLQKKINAKTYSSFCDWYYTSIR